jgi:hypothetical protein
VQLTAEQVAHLAELRDESELLALVNARIAALGGEMIPVRGNSQPPDERPDPTVGLGRLGLRGCRKENTATTTHTPPLTS